MLKSFIFMLFCIKYRHITSQNRLYLRKKWVYFKQSTSGETGYGQQRV